MKQFVTFITLFALLVTIDSCGVSKQTYPDPIYDDLVKVDYENHSYLPFVYTSRTMFQWVAIRAYVEKGVLYFRVNQSEYGELVANYEHLTNNVTFSGGGYGRLMKNYNCPITDKTLKLLSEDCSSLKLKGTNLRNTKGFRQFCKNVYELYHPIYLKEIDRLLDESTRLVDKKYDLKGRVSELKDKLSDANNKYMSEYSTVCEQVEDSVKNYWRNFFFQKHSKSRFSYVSSIVSDVEYTLLSPNSAGGCDFIFHATNQSNKTIKYAYITVRFKNAVNDFVPCDIRGWKTYIAKETGPIAHNQVIGADGVWGNAIYNHSARKPIISGITIEYMDKSKVVLSGSDLDMMTEFKALCNLILREQKKEVRKIPNRQLLKQQEVEITSLEYEISTINNELITLNTRIEDNKTQVKKLQEQVKKPSMFSGTELAFVRSNY